MQKSIESLIEYKLKNTLNPLKLIITNESSKHINHFHPDQNSDFRNGETHFHIHITSKEFENLSQLERMRSVYKILNIELSNNIHALSLDLKAPSEVKTL